MNNRGVGLNYGMHSNPYLGYMQPELMMQNNYSDWYELRNMVEPNLNEIDTFTSVSFDSHDEIIWGGLRSGRVISYLSPTLHKYVSIEAHKSQVKQLLPFENGIISLSSEYLRIHSKGGVSRCEFYDYNQVVTKFNCATFTSKTKDEFLLAGEGDQALLFDVETAQPKSYVIPNGSNMNNICKVASSRTVCFGNIDGRVGIYDPRTYREIQSFSAHSGGIYDLDLKGDFLVTCGFSSLRGGKYFIDPYIKVFDLRSLRQLPYITFPSGPYQLKFHPKFSSTLVVISQSGYFQFCDVQSGDMNINKNRYYQVNMSSEGLSCFDISSSGETICFGEVGGIIRQWADREHFKIHDFSKPLQLVDRTPPVPPVKISMPSPLCSVPKPDYKPMALTSDWPEDLEYKVGRPPVTIDPEILSILNIIDFVGYAPNAINKKRNHDLSPPLEKKKYTSHSQTSQSYPLLSRKYNLSAKKERPYSTYRKIDAKNFGFNENQRSKMINESKFSGIWNTHPSSYCNALLQTLYFIPTFRKAVKEHLCSVEYCLCCELGFLFHNLDMGERNSCPNTNFLLSMQQIPSAAQHNLLISGHYNCNSEYDKSARILEAFNTFLLTHLHREMKSNPPLNPDLNLSIINNNINNNDNNNEASLPPTTIIQRLFGHTIAEHHSCGHCNSEKRIEIEQFHLQFRYPPVLEKQSPHSFIHLLQQNIHGFSYEAFYCSTCKMNRHRKVTSTLLSLPPILTINTNISAPQHRDVYSPIIDPNLPPSLRPPPSIPLYICFTSTSPFIVKEVTDLNHVKSLLRSSSCNNNNNNNDNNNDGGGDDRVVIYELSSVASAIFDRHDGDEIRPHYISHIKVSNVYSFIKQFIHQTYHQNPPPSPPGNDKVGDDNKNDTIATDHKNDNNDNDNNDDLNDPSMYGEGEWFMFNDLKVMRDQIDEFLRYHGTWRQPAIMTYTQITPQSHPHLYESDDNVKITRTIRKSSLVEKRTITENVFFTANPLERYSLHGSKPLEIKSLPKSGDIVAIDSEFVSLSPPEMEIRSDGKNFITSAEQSTLARVSVLWSTSPSPLNSGSGSGSGGSGDEDVLIIDDYIANRVPISNYLTRFSGIVPGDLDPTISPHYVVPLKSSYLKLRYLVDIGCKFVGHGLKKDFSMINLMVPKHQVFDTVELFHLSHQRNISLRFLVSYLLKQEIQMDTHCSIEDAKAALELYFLYEKLRADGKIDETLKELYSYGRMMNWKLPSDNDDDDEEFEDFQIPPSSSPFLFPYSLQQYQSLNYNTQ